MSAQVETMSMAAGVPVPWPRCGAAERAEGRVTTTMTASLLVAGLDDDDAIHLTVADTDHASRTTQVVFPSPTESDGAADPAQRARMRASREAFIREIGRPSAEASMLLYGAARLTLVRDSSRSGRVRVLDFLPLETAIPPATRCDCARRHTARCLDTAI